MIMSPKYSEFIRGACILRLGACIEVRQGNHARSKCTVCRHSLVASNTKSVVVTLLYFSWLTKLKLYFCPY